VADLVHLTAESAARGVADLGIPARSRSGRAGYGVFCMPFLPSFTLTHGWAREVRRWHHGRLVAIDVHLPDDEPVTAGRRGGTPESLPLSVAVRRIEDLPDPRGWEVFVPRAIRPGEVRRVRPIPPSVGWRCPVAVRHRRPPGAQRPELTERELLAALAAGPGRDELISAVWALGGRP